MANAHLGPSEQQPTTIPQQNLYAVAHRNRHKSPNPAGGRTRPCASPFVARLAPKLLCPCYRRFVGDGVPTGGGTFMYISQAPRPIRRDRLPHSTERRGVRRKQHEMRSLKCLNRPPRNSSRRAVDSYHHRPTVRIAPSPC